MTTATSRAPKYPDVSNLIGGRLVAGEGAYLDVEAPADASLLSRVPLSSAAALDQAVAAAAGAFPEWAATPLKERVQVFFRYRALLERHMEELTRLVTEEHGKLPDEARAEVLKAMEVTEFACALPEIAAGEVLEVSRGIECRTDVTRSGSSRRSRRSTSR